MKKWCLGLIGLSLCALISPAYYSVAEEISLTEIETGKVLLPWPELKKMLETIENLKKETTQPEEKTEPPAPIDYSITQAHFEGAVKDRSIRFDATFNVRVLKAGWVTIPFFSNEVGIEKATIDFPETVTTPKASLLMTIPADALPPTEFVRNADGYALLTQGPTTLTAQVTFYIPIQVTELMHTVSFVPPKAVINHITLTIPEKDIHLIQKTAHTHITQQAEAVVIETVLSERDNFHLQWKIEKDSGISRKSLATIHALASVDKAHVTVSSTLTLRYLDSLDPVVFQLPKAVEVLSVESLDIAQWATEKREKAQLIKLIGAIDPRTPVKIDLSYRLPLSTLPADMTLPTVAVLGVDNLEGFLGLEALDNLEITAKSVNAGYLMPAKNLPKTLWQKAANPLLYGYQFQKNTFQPTLSIKRYQEIQTVVANADLVDCVTHRTLEGKSITRILFFIRNNDRQFLTLTLPQHSRIWQAFLEGKPIKPARKDSGEILIPMKKSTTQGEALQSFTIEVGYIAEVNKLTLKGDILNQLPAIDIPISYLRWNLYLPEYYGYSRFEGPLKQVAQFSDTKQQVTQAQIDIPIQGQRFLFEKYLIVDEQPYMRGQYGQFLGDDIFLSLHAVPTTRFDDYNESEKMLDQLDRFAPAPTSEYRKRNSSPQQQVLPNATW